MREENGFVNSLLKVAKEWEKANYVKKSKLDFESQMKNNEKSQEKEESENENEKNERDKKEEQEDVLKMEVYEDKEYDIEEVKFWNFISKNKGIKPSIVRTIVYKVPESSYIVKKCSVFVPTKKEKASTSSLPDSNEIINLENNDSKSHSEQINNNSKISEVSTHQNDEISLKNKSDSNSKLNSNSNQTNKSLNSLSIKKVTTVSPSTSASASTSTNTNLTQSNQISSLRRVGRPKGSANLIKLSKAQPNRNFFDSNKKSDHKNDDEEGFNILTSDEFDLLKLKPIASPLISSSNNIQNNITNDNINSTISNMSPNNSKSEIQRFVSTKFKMEDLILIDEDDDIIGYNEDDDSEDQIDNNLNEITINNVSNENENLLFNEDLDNRLEDENGLNDESNVENQNESLKPKIVIDKAEEPSPILNVNSKYSSKSKSNRLKTSSNTKTSSSNETIKPSPSFSVINTEKSINTNNSTVTTRSRTRSGRSYRNGLN